MNKAQQILGLFIGEAKDEVSKKGLKDFNIDKEFDYLNKTLFDNKIPKPPVLGFMVDKKRLGVVNTDYVNGKAVTQNLLITNFYDLTLPQFRSILLHEMTHLLQDTLNMRFKTQKDAHGSFFLRTITDLNAKIKKLGLESEIAEIRPTEDSSEINTFEDDRLSKPVGVMIVKEPRGMSFVPMSLDGLVLNIQYFKDTMSKHIPNSTLEFYKCDSSFLKKYKTNVSKFKNVSLYVLQDKDYQTILKDGTKVDDSGSMGISVARLKKPIGVILLKKSSGNTSMGNYGLEGMIANIPSYIEKFKYGYRKDFSVYFISTTNPLVSNYPIVKKDFSAIKTYKISSEDFNTLLTDTQATVINKYEC